MRVAGCGWGQAVAPPAIRGAMTHQVGRNHRACADRRRGGNVYITSDACRTDSRRRDAGGGGSPFGPCVVGKAAGMRDAGSHRDQFVASAGEEARTGPGGGSGRPWTSPLRTRTQGREGGGETARLRSSASGSGNASVTGPSGRYAPLASSAVWRYGRRSRRASLAPIDPGTQRR